MSEVKQYADRDIIDLDEKGDYYFRHVDAMTGESLHSKSDIAAELGHRDMLIDIYRDLCAELVSKMSQVKKRLNDGSCDEWTIKALAAIIDLEIVKAETILGEKNGNAN